MRTARDTYIYNTLITEGMKKATAEFFIELIDLLETSEPLTSSSGKLANRINKSERSVQRYIKELTENFNYIFKKPIWNNDNPDKPYILHTEYFTTYHSKDLLAKANEYKPNRSHNKLPASEVC